MRNWIAGAMTVLGTLLVLSGGGTIVLRAWLRPAAGTAAGTGESGTTTAAVPERPALAPDDPSRRLFGRLGPPDRLIAWGILLLVLAAVAAGAIGFQFGANAQAR